ncbi:MAG: hypothetical protein WC863_00085 [Patescibacteria group bacterium]
MKKISAQAGTFFIMFLALAVVFYGTLVTVISSDLNRDVKYLIYKSGSSLGMVSTIYINGKLSDTRLIIIFKETSSSRQETIAIFPFWRGWLEGSNKIVKIIRADGRVVNTDYAGRIEKSSVQWEDRFLYSQVIEKVRLITKPENIAFKFNRHGYDDRNLALIDRNFVLGLFKSYR